MFRTTVDDIDPALPIVRIIPFFPQFGVHKVMQDLYHQPYFNARSQFLTGAEASSESFGDKIWAGGQQRQQEGSIRPPTAKGSQNMYITKSIPTMYCPLYNLIGCS